ncbi:Uncharacterised protein [Mycobacterium tuberculosis]|nr:Uncharacterised protein [Mycobacterium tuberculosis]
MFSPAMTANTNANEAISAVSSRASYSNFAQPQP